MRPMSQDLDRGCGSRNVCQAEWGRTESQLEQLHGNLLRVSWIWDPLSLAMGVWEAESGTGNAVFGSFSLCPVQALGITLVRLLHCSLALSLVRETTLLGISMFGFPASHRIIWTPSLLFRLGKALLRFPKYIIPFGDNYT